MKWEGLEKSVALDTECLQTSYCAVILFITERKKERIIIFFLIFKLEAIIRKLHWHKFTPVAEQVKNPAVQETWV